MDFHTLIKGHAARSPQRIAYQDQDRALDYAGLLREVDRLAGLMHEQGARRGERLALWMPNSMEC